jgi:F-type H+-transporting ATPase subunit gamma
MLAKAGEVNHPYLQESESKTKAIITITSNRGLAGGYNSNVVKAITGSGLSPEETVIYAIGNKGEEALSRKGYEISASYPAIIEEPTYEDAMEISKILLEEYAEGKIGEIYLAYTHFKNTVSQEPKLLKLLPVEINDEDISEESATSLMNFEPNEEEALDMIIPKYVTSLIYGGLVEAVASENGARMQAMDSATSNAEDIINDLSLKYNRARQGSITQELTEIIAGAEAIS